MAAAAANKADVRRVVLTSSCAGERMAVAAAGRKLVQLWLMSRRGASQFADQWCRMLCPRVPAIKGCKPAPPKEGSTYSEADWNETSTVGRCTIRGFAGCLLTARLADAASSCCASRDPA